MIEPKNILIVRTDRIGDVVLTLPLAAILKKKFPQIRVSFLVREYTRALAANNRFIDDVFVLKEKNGKILLWDNVHMLKDHHFDSCIVVFPVFVIALIMLFSGIKKRIGTGYRWYSFLFNRKVYEHRKYAEHHELEYNVNLLKFFGIDEDINKENAVFGLRPVEKTEYKIEQMLLQNSIDPDKPIVIIHPGSGGSAVDLPLKSFKALSELMAQNLDINIIITGSEKEKTAANELIINNSVKNFAGQLSLEELIAMIARSSLLIANSTGPIHIAAALGKNVIGFYPKILACLPERWGPYTIKSRVFMPKLDCDSCTREQCTRLKCMESIDMIEVFDNIKIMLEAQHTTEK